MSLGSPWMLLWLAVVPLLVLAYVRLVRRRSRRADRLASEGLVPTTASRRGLRWRRHVPFALFASALDPRLHRARPADDEPRAAATRRDGDPRVRRVQQHAGRRSRADPDRRRRRPPPPRSPSGSRARSGSASWRSATSAVTVLRPTDRQGGGGRGHPAPLGGRRHIARSGHLHLAQHDRREAAADRRVRARERRRRGRHRLLRLVGDRPPLGRGEHIAPRSAADRRGCLLGRRPRPCDRHRDTGGSGGRDRRIQRRDGARRGAADRDRGRDRRHVQRRPATPPRSSGSTTPSTSSSLASSVSTR